MVMVFGVLGFRDNLCYPTFIEEREMIIPKNQRRVPNESKHAEHIWTPRRSEDTSDTSRRYGQTEDNVVLGGLSKLGK